LALMLEEAYGGRKRIHHVGKGGNPFGQGDAGKRIAHIIGAPAGRVAYPETARHGYGVTSMLSRSDVPHGRHPRAATALAAGAREGTALRVLFLL